jgi:exosortase/archaeosortase family protein
MSRATIYLTLQIVSFWPVWRWYAARMTDASDDPWGIIALVTALLFLFVRGRDLEMKPVHFLLSSLFVAMYLVTFSFTPPLVRAVLATCAIAATLSPACLGRSVHVGVLGLFLLSLPIIASLQFYLGYPVRYLTAALAGKLISIIGYDVSAQGTALLWMGEIISVDAPCAGIRMLWTGLYLNFTLACFTGLSSFETWMTYSFSMIAIFFGNVLRASALFFTETGIFHGPSWTHQGIGIAVFCMIAAAIVTFNRYVQVEREVAA